MNKGFVLILFLLYSLGNPDPTVAQSAMINVDARKTISLDGEWKAIPDPAGAGDWKKIWEDRKPVHKTDFV
jgi:beta-glucuronidase